jgi:hypothetical protein
LELTNAVHVDIYAHTHINERTTTNLRGQTKLLNMHHQQANTNHQQQLYTNTNTNTNTNINIRNMLTNAQQLRMKQQPDKNRFLTNFISATTSQSPTSSTEQNLNDSGDSDSGTSPPAIYTKQTNKSKSTPLRAMQTIWGSQSEGRQTVPRTLINMKKLEAAGFSSEAILSALIASNNDVARALIILDADSGKKSTAEGTHCLSVNNCFNSDTDAKVRIESGQKNKAPPMPKMTQLPPHDISPTRIFPPHQQIYRQHTQTAIEQNIVPSMEIEHQKHTEQQILKQQMKSSESVPQSVPVVASSDVDASTHESVSNSAPSLVSPPPSELGPSSIESGPSPIQSTELSNTSPDIEQNNIPISTSNSAHVSSSHESPSSPIIKSSTPETDSVFIELLNREHQFPLDSAPTDTLDDTSSYDTDPSSQFVDDYNNPFSPPPVTEFDYTMRNRLAAAEHVWTLRPKKSKVNNPVQVTCVYIYNQMFTN